MPTLANLRKVLQSANQWEALATQTHGVPFSTGCSLSRADPAVDPNQTVYFSPAGAVYNYLPRENAWIQVSGVGGPVTSFANGNSNCWNPNGPSGTTSAGTSLGITTDYTSARNLAGYTIRLLSGAGAGQERVIAYNAPGPNTTFVVAQAWTTPPDATTTWVLRTGRFYAFNGTAGTGGYLSYWNHADYTQRPTLSVAGLPATWAPGSCAMFSPHVRQFASGVASGGGASTLTDSSKNWVRSWTNYQIRITSGPGAGQIRTIASSTSSIITVSVAWAVQPAAGSTYVIEANEDHIYLIGNGSKTTYLYTISTNTWSTFTTGTSRAVVAGADCLLAYIDQDTHPLWTPEASGKNGQYLYSLAGGNTGNIDRLDITTATWESAPGSSQHAEVISTGSSFAYANGYLFICPTSQGRTHLCRYSPSTGVLDGFAAAMPVPSPFYVIFRSNVNRMFPIEYTVGGVKVTKIAYGAMTGTNLFAMQLEP